MLFNAQLRPYQTCLKGLLMVLFAILNWKFLFMKTTTIEQISVHLRISLHAGGWMVEKNRNS